MNAEQSPEDLQKLWDNPDNWSGSIYFCKKDPRLWVPKRRPWMGWTINFGHRYGTAALLVMILGPMLLMTLSLIFGT